MRATLLFCMANRVARRHRRVGRRRTRRVAVDHAAQGQEIDGDVAADLADRARPRLVHVRGTNEGPGEGDSSPDASRTSIGTVPDPQRRLPGHQRARDPGGVRPAHPPVRRARAARVRGGCRAPTTSPSSRSTRLAAADPAAGRLGQRTRRRDRGRDSKPVWIQSQRHRRIVSAKERVVRSRHLHEAPAQDLYSFFIQTDASITWATRVGLSSTPTRRHRRQRRLLGRPPAAARAGHRLAIPIKHRQIAAAAPARQGRRAALLPGRRRAAAGLGADRGAQAPVDARRAHRQRGQEVAGRGGRTGAGRRGS